jgi:RHS repeat-associated protein
LVRPTREQQYVWGLTYVDELIQVGNIDWYGEGIQSRHWAATDANYNVLGVIDYWGSLVERYEYTPYGQRQVFRSAGSIVSDDYVSSEIGYQTRYFSGANDPGLHAPTHLGRRAYGFDLGRMPVGLCEVGHQGLLHDEHVGLVYNRARHLHPTLGRFMQRDPAGYVDGLSFYAYLRLRPFAQLDPTGMKSVRLEFATFIPQSIGVNVPGAPANAGDIRWFNEPGGINYMTGTDNREKAGQDGTSRIQTKMTLNFNNIGNLTKEKLDVTVTSDASHRIKVGARVPPPGQPWRWVYAGGYESATSNPKWDTETANLRTRSMTLSLASHWAAGKYPFPPANASWLSFITPSINYDFIVEMLCNKHGDFIFVSGSHNEFPAYELLLNGRVFHEYYPEKGSGPNHLNLGVFSNNFSTGWIKVN